MVMENGLAEMPQVQCEGPWDRKAQPLLSISLTDDPCGPAKCLQLFAVIGLVPDYFMVERRSSSRMQVSMSVSIDGDRAAIERVLRKIVCLQTVCSIDFISPEYSEILQSMKGSGDV